MPYLLDGNNLIVIVQRTSRPTEADRQALVAEIAGRLRRTRARATIFFDGPSGDRTTSLGALSIRAAGGSADDAIVREVASARRPGESIVVTADRGLASRVREAGGKVLAPSEFFERFGQAPSPAHPASAPVDVEDWLRFFGDPSNRDEK